MLFGVPPTVLCIFLPHPRKGQAEGSQTIHNSKVKGQVTSRAHPAPPGTREAQPLQVDLRLGPGYQGTRPGPVSEMEENHWTGRAAGPNFDPKGQSHHKTALDLTPAVFEVASWPTSSLLPARPQRGNLGTCPKVTVGNQFHVGMRLEGI